MINAIWKPNSRNAALLEEYLRIRGAEYLKLRAEGKDDSAIITLGDVEKGGNVVIADQVRPGAGRRRGETIFVPGTSAKEDNPTSLAKSPSRLTRLFSSKRST